MFRYRKLAFKMLKERFIDLSIMAEDEVRLTPGPDKIRRYWVSIISFYEELCEFDPTADEARAIFFQGGVSVKYFRETFSMLKRNLDNREEPQTVLYWRLRDARLFSEFDIFLKDTVVKTSTSTSRAA